MIQDIRIDEISPAIQWHEGMLLMPHHFQQFAGRLESLIQFVTTLTSPYGWGVLRFDYDRAALVGGKFRVLRVEAITPDGSLLIAGTEIGIDLELDLKQSAEQARASSFKVHLVVPAQNALSTRGDLARYESYDGTAVADDTTGEGAIHIPRLRPKVSLWAGENPPPRFQAIALLEIQQQGESYQEAGFIAPMLSVPSSSSLGEQCEKVTSLIREKIYFLADQLQCGAYKEGDPEIMETRARIQSMAAGLPMAEALLQSGKSHPFQVYLAMCNLAGNIARITLSLLSPFFPPYRHEDLRTTFQPVLGFIQQSVSEAVVEAWRRYSFRLIDGVFQLGPMAALDKVIAGKGTLDAPLLALAARPSSGSSLEAAAQWAENCVIGSVSLIPTLLANRVPGAERRITERLPDLSPPRGMVLFAIQADATAVKPDEVLQLVDRFNEQMRPAEVVLYIRRARREG